MHSETKPFHIGDIITITSGKLVGLDQIGGVYNILGWMTDESLMTHQLTRVSDECEPTLRRAFPDLAALEVPSIKSLEDAQRWYADLERQGVVLWRAVPKLDNGHHARIDPILEAQYMVGADKVITVGDDHD